MYRVTLGAMVSLLSVLSCAPVAVPAAPAPTEGVGVTPSEPLSDADYRQQVIDAARAEGEVNATIHTSWSPDGIRQLEDAIEREYGARIRINYTPIGNYVQRASSLFSEVEAGATPSFDLYQSSDTTSAALAKAGATEAVRWTPLLPAGTPAKLVTPNREHLIIYTDHFGLMSDPTVIPDAELPRSIKDLGDPKWRGKVMLFVSTNTYLPWVIRLGRDETLAALRGAVRNGAVADTFPNQLTRFAAKEYPLSTTGVTFHHVALSRGIPSRCTPLDFSANADHHVSVARRAVHPNAAKLLAAILAGPEGQRIMAEHIGVGNRYYENTRENHLEQEALAAGFPSFQWQDYPNGMDFALSPEGQSVVREMEQILQGG
jgi:ABC-type Fe3+ transport system substrate-binding protein